MAFKFYIDGQLTDQPVNDTTALSSSIIRDSELNSLLITQDASLTWNNNNDLEPGTISGYQYLKGLFDDSVCLEAEIEIQDEVDDSTTVTVYTGIIKIPNIKVSLQEQTLTTKVTDNSYYSYISNNRSLKVNLNADQTKSKITTTPLQAYTLDLFNSNGCAYGSFAGLLYKAFLLYDVFEFVVRCITDGRVGFRSTYLQSFTYPIFLTKGQNLLNPVSIYPLAQGAIEISFEELYREVDKLKNLNFYIDSSDQANPVLVIEDALSLYEQGIASYSFDDIKFLSESIADSQLYGTIAAGDNNNVDGQAAWYTWNQGISYFGWKNEQFFPLGQCNLNRELNLTSEWIIDNNAIQDILIGQNTSQIDTIVLIECDNVDDVLFTADAHQYDFFGQGGCYYNLGLNNFSKLQNHSNKFETAFGNFLGLGGDGFRALIGDTAAQDINYVTAPASDPNFIPQNGITVNPGQYVNETTLGGYDGNNNYNNATQRYVVPTSGDYSFSQVLNWVQSGLVANEIFQLANTLTLYDNTLTIKAQYSTGGNFGGNGLRQNINNWVVNCNAGDIVIASYAIGYRPEQAPQQQIARNFYLSHLSYFECNGTPTGGITITQGNSLIRKYIYDFDYYLDQTDWINISTNLTKQYAFEKDGVTRYGWIETIKYNNWTGQSQIKLITNNATTTL